jgi:hypothetical protein
LRTLDTNQPVPGSQLIVLEEHVDYWDDLGWKDPFSSHPLTERQTTYAKRLHLDGPYTPQMVVDGIDEFVGSDRARANRAFDKARPAPKVMVRISALNLQNGKLTAHVDAGTVSEAAEVFVALALEHAESSVLHGENRGHHLQHVAVVKSLSKVGTVGKGETFSSDVSLSTGPAGESYRVIAFIQEANQGKVVGAAVERK